MRRLIDDRASTWQRAAVLLGVRLVWTFILAVGCNFVLDALQARGIGVDPFSHKAHASLSLFLLGSVVVWLLVLLVQSIVGSLAVTTVLAAVATAGLGIANYEKMRLRHEPLFPNDLQFAGDPGFLKDMVGVRLFALFGTGILVVLGLCVLGFWLGRRLLPRFTRSTNPRAWRAMLAIRVVTALACVLSLAYLADFNSPGNEARKTYDAAGAFWKPWNQSRNYEQNGFVGGFLYNMRVQAMKEPADYSAAEMQKIVNKYTAVARRINRNRDPHALDHVNVVSVLSESFSDPTRIKGIHVEGGDPIPFTRELMKKTTSGNMLAQDFGGGTANMEFEVLTGMSMAQFAPQVSIAYQMLVPNYKNFPSVVGYFKAHGHEAIAIHPFETKMYRRSEVYDNFGFKKFIYDQTMTFQHKIQRNKYISDDSAFQEVLLQIESHKDPLFVNLITMQNHFPYGGKYNDPPTVTGASGRARSELANYVKGLSYSDQALKNLIDELKRSNEKTIVVLYGDHLSSAYPSSLFRKNTERVMHETPFLVWSNFSSVNNREPTTSPSGFMNLVFQQAGAAIPPYYALLDELHREVPAMDGNIFVDGDDQTVRRANLSPRAKELLHDYRLVQYDLSVGRRYSQHDLFYSPGTTVGAAAPRD